MKSPALPVLLVLTYLSGCAGTGQGPAKDINIPADVTVVAPAEAIPKDLAAFSGKWAGAWYGAATSTYMADQVIVVERISSPTSARVAYAGIGRWGNINGQPWFYRLDATFVSNALQFTLPSGVAVTCRLNRDGTLDATGTSGGGTWHGTFTRSAN